MSTSRRAFVLTAPLLLAGAMASGHAQGNPPPHTPLPTDTNLSVSIGVCATWQSQQINATRQMLLSAEVSSYTLSETPDIYTLLDHQIAGETLPPEQGWAVFAPQNDQFQFQFDIADAQNRLGKIVVKNLLTGDVLAQIPAAANGSALTGVLTGDWNTVYYQVDGYDKAGNALFRLGVTQGKFDNFVPFAISNGFSPYRPAFIACAHHTTPDGLMGSEGDPYNVMGVISGTGGGFSVGCGYQDKINDKASPDSIIPPADFFRYIKHKKALDTASANLNALKSGDPQALKDLRDLLSGLTKEDTTRALTNVDIAPYSDACGHWHPAFNGAATAVYIIPYTRKTANKGLLGILAQAMIEFLKPGAKILSALGIDALNQFLMTPQGAPYGYIQGEIRVVGDVYTVDATEAYKASDQRPILQEVTFRLTPDIAPPTGLNGGGSVVSTGAWTIPAPPGPSNGGDLSFDVNGIAKKQLAKGYKWKASGCISSTRGYRTGTSEEFQTPIDAPVTVPCTLTVLLHLKIVANASCVVTVKRGADVQAQGPTTSINGQNVFDMFQVTPATYIVEGTASPLPGSRVPRKATQTVTVNTAVEQAVQLTF